MFFLGALCLEAYWLNDLLFACILYFLLFCFTLLTNYLTGVKANKLKSMLKKSFSPLNQKKVFLVPENAEN